MNIKSMAIIIACAVTLCGGTVSAQKDYPEKPIKFILPVEAGSGGDILTRPLVDLAAKILGQPVMVINKPGASGSIAMKEVHDAKPDGYTIGMTTSFVVTNKMQGIFPYDQRDFDFIGVFQTDPAVVVCTAKRPWASIKEMAEFAKTNPGDVSAATSSKGAIFWIAAVALADAIGADLNIIPQAGAGGMAITQVSGGHVDLCVSGLPEAKSQIEAGNVRLLAIMGEKRAPGSYNKAPTMKEMGYSGGEVSTARSVYAPKNLPKPIFDKLVSIFKEAAHSEEYQKFLLEQNSQPLWLSGNEASAYYEKQGAIFKPILAKSGLLKGTN